MGRPGAVKPNASGSGPTRSRGAPQVGVSPTARSSCRGPDLTARDYQPRRLAVPGRGGEKRITAFNHLTADIAYTEFLTSPCLRSDDAAGAFPPTIKTAGATGVLETPLAA